MSDLYDEALADAKKLREVATERATKLVVEDVIPKIKEMIERELLSESYDEDVEDNDDLLFDLVDKDDAADAHLDHSSVEDGLPPEDTMVNVPEPPVETSDVASGEVASISLPDEEGKVVLDMDALHHTDDSVDDEYELTGESVHALKALLNQTDINESHIELRCIKMQEAIDKLNFAKDKGIDTIKNQETARQIKVECERLYRQVRDSEQRLSESVSKNLQDKLESVYGAIIENYTAAGHFNKIISQVKKINRSAAVLNKLNESRQLTKEALGNHVVSCFKMLKELHDLHSSVRGLNESLSPVDDVIDSSAVLQVESALAKLYKEIRQMARKNGKLVNEQEVMLRLSLPDELEVEPTDLDVTVVEAEPENEEGDDMEDLDLDVAPEHDEEEVSDGYVAEDDYLLKVDLPGDDELDMSDVDVSVEDSLDLDHDEEDEEDEMPESALKDDDIVEIDEAALVKEMKRMRALREANSVSHGGHGPGDDLSDFGGGEDEDELFVDGQEMNQGDDKVVAKGSLEENEVSELDELDDADCSEEDAEHADKDGKNAGHIKEANHLAMKVRKELAEAKLLNTKLVALNRLLQVPGLNRKTKESIVESLDKGKSQAEVEQLYRKIVAKLKGKTAVRESVAGTQVLGSSSRVTTSSSSSAEGKEDQLLEKWARIAGTDVLKD